MRTHEFSRLLALSLIPIAVACGKSVVSWIDKAPVATYQPSPLTALPLSRDSMPADAGDSMAAFVETQELLREAGGMSLLDVHTEGLGEGSEQDAIDEAATQVPDASNAALRAAEPATVSAAPPGTPDLGRGVAPADPERCVRSLRMAYSYDGEAVAVWWRRRGGGRVALVSAYKPGTLGAQWSGLTTVDGGDTGPAGRGAGSETGCGRSAPALFVDPRTGFAHVVYSLPGENGGGVFYARQRSRGVLFEVPQPVAEGGSPVTARVAAFGPVVAVAYENPAGGANPGIVLSVSRDTGAFFTGKLAATSAGESGRDPYVSVRGRFVVVGWSDPAGVEGPPVFKVRRARVVK